MKTGLIYIIKNNVNNKVYIGQTTSSLTTRFHQHLKNSTLKSRHYKLYNAIKKYGKEHFYIELLENNVPLSHLNEKEIYYIEKYNSFNNGYNSSKGGDGRTINKHYDEKQIIKMYKAGHSESEIASMFNISYATISRTLARLKINTRHDGNKYEQFDEESFIKMWNSNEADLSDMAKKFNVNEKTIRRHAKRLGLKRKTMKKTNY